MLLVYAAMAGELLEFTSPLRATAYSVSLRTLMKLQSALFCSAKFLRLRKATSAAQPAASWIFQLVLTCLVVLLTHWASLIDGLALSTLHRRPIGVQGPGIMQRQPVCEPVQTGLLLAIDAMVPVGRISVS